MVATQMPPPQVQQPPPTTNQAQALLASAASAQANQQRAPFWNGALGGAPPPLLAAGLPGNFYPQMAAFAAAQENATAMVAVSKLGAAKGNSSTNSSLVVRSSVRKLNVNGGLLSVAQWTRKTVEENLEWLVKLCKRHASGEKTILLAYGDGCETLVLLDDHINTMPKDFSKIKKIGIGCSMVDANTNLDETKLAAEGVLQPSDSIWEHLRFETLNTEQKVEKCLFIHACVTIYTSSMDGRRRVLQVKTGAGLSYQPNPLFEQQVLSLWAGHGPGAHIMDFPLAPATQDDGGPPQKETLITFNPKELLLLEKAFDNRLTTRDLKANVIKFTEDDRKAAQLVIKRANDEFVMRGPPKKRRKKGEAKQEGEKKEGEAKEKESAPAPSEDAKAKDVKTEAEKKETPPIKKTTKKEVKKDTPTKKDASAKKSTPAKKEAPMKKEPVKDDDDDDEPISKMVKKEKSPAKKSSSRRSSSGSAKDGKTKPPKPEKRERRGASKDTSSTKKRSKSKAKN